MRNYIIFYSWYGGKFSLLKKILPLLPEHQIFYEPYGGSGALTLNNYKCDNRVFNEYSSEIVNYGEQCRMMNHVRNSGKKFWKLITAKMHLNMPVTSPIIQIM